MTSDMWIIVAGFGQMAHDGLLKPSSYYQKSKYSLSHTNWMIEFENHWEFDEFFY